MECLRTVDHGLGDQAAIERGELSTMGYGQCKQVGVGYLAGVEKTRGKDALGVEEGDIVWPELMAAESEQDRHQLGDGCGSSRRVGVAWVADNADNAIFSQGACGPCLPALSCEPIVRPVVLHVRRVDESNQDVDVQQVARRWGHWDYSNSS